ncbi:PREDICTED: cytochrome b-c1 complex subunit 6-like isoform X1 [Populus euphratica]|uniref:Cytochrome b-c1 complex subunit 6 n=1 Tax=Populus euphratica TaxID=75702 RepID=A0AAJ6V8I8_POPEU|nr:PREDICTED: cytochrome b-c1 complex subunit 6-like isoform X1 [Populus euphratica]
MADEELVDQKKYLEDSCRPKCVKPLLEYEELKEMTLLIVLCGTSSVWGREMSACVKRVEGDDSGHKHCTGQYFDYWFCIDKCVAPKLFSKLN